MFGAGWDARFSTASVVRAHGGHVRLTTAPGRGTTVRGAIPLGPAADVKETRSFL